jgi:sporulation protein YlmC with PRC-barrel domain
MKQLFAVLAMFLLSLCAGVAFAQDPPAQAPVAGTVPLGVSTIQLQTVVKGWSAKKDLMGKNVVNDNKDKIGKIDDVILTPTTDAKGPVASYAIIGVGGFLGVGRRDVAIPLEQLKIENNNLMLAGATKDALKAMPPFEYAKKK